MTIATWTDTWSYQGAPSFTTATVSILYDSSAAKYYFNATATNVFYGVGNDDTKQELYLQKRTDKSLTIPCDSCNTINAQTRLYEVELPNKVERVGSDPQIMQPNYPACNGVGASRRFFWANLSSGSNNWDLKCRRIVHWDADNPFEVLFDILVGQHDGTTYWRGILERSTWEDAKDAYDDIPAEVNYTPEVGSKMSQSIKDIMDCTTAWFAIRPSDDDGVLRAHVGDRQTSVERDTQLDLDTFSDYGIETWEAVVRMDLRINALEIAYGKMYHFTDIGTYEVRRSFPHGMVADLDIFKMRWTEDDDTEATVRLQCPHTLKRQALPNLFDLAWWYEPQIEIVVEMGLLHWNYEVGDIVRVSHEGLGLDADTFIVRKKKARFKKQTATLTLLQYRGAGEASILGHVADSDLLFVLSTQTTGNYSDGEQLLDVAPRFYDRIIDESGIYGSVGMFAALPTSATTRAQVDDPGTGIDPPCQAMRYTLSLTEQSAGLEYDSIAQNKSLQRPFHLVLVCDVANVAEQIMSLGYYTPSVQYIEWGVNGGNNVGWYLSDTATWYTVDLTSALAALTSEYCVLTISMNGTGITGGGVAINGSWVGTGLTTPSSLSYTNATIVYLNNDRFKLQLSDRKALFWMMHQASEHDLSWGIEDRLVSRYRCE